MANTKKSLRILKTNTFDDCVDVANAAAVITAAEMGITYDSGAGNTGLPAGNVVFDSYSTGTAGVEKIDFVGVDVDSDIELTLIDVTNGRAVFPRRTFVVKAASADAAATAMAAAVDGEGLKAGDGLTIGCAVTSGTSTAVDVTMPAGTILRVAASDGAAISTTTAPILPKGYSTAEALAYAKDFMADQYGRTNRVGFPVVEPADVVTAIGANNYDLMVVTKLSDVKFDKNQGNSYQDVEEFHFLIETALVTNAASTNFADS